MYPPHPAELDTSDRRWQRVARYLATNQYDAAKTVIERILTDTPNNVRALILCADISIAERQLQAACSILCQAARVSNDDLKSIIQIIYRLYKVGELSTMRQCLSNITITNQHPAIILAKISHMWQLLGDHRKALSIMQSVINSGFIDREFNYEYCMEILFNGDVTNAEKCLLDHSSRFPETGRAVLAASRIHKIGNNNKYLNIISHNISHTLDGTVERAALDFALFSELHIAHRYDEAWQALTNANIIMSNITDWNNDEFINNVDNIIRICDESFVLNNSTCVNDITPIFIIGLPRSGTTLVERIISNHPMVASCGELIDFPMQVHWACDLYCESIVSEELLNRITKANYTKIGNRYIKQTAWRAGKDLYYIDKLPENFLLAGLIHRALPRARIVNVIRSPLDTFFSNWVTLFNSAHGFAYRAQFLANYIHQYVRLMEHWRKVMPGVIIDVRYDRLVREPMEVSAQLIRDCGLPAVSDYSDVTRNDSAVATLSSAQVRRPIRHPLGRTWYPYRRKLRTLLSSMAGVPSDHARS